MARHDDDPVGSAREEAERLIAAGLAAASYAMRQGRRMRRDRDDVRRDDSRRGRDDSLVDDLAGLAGLASRFLGDQGRGYGRNERRDPRRGRGHEEHQEHRGGWNIATGSAACCVCPICRAIDLLRDPPPEFVERVASGASDLAAGVTTVLRAFGERAGRGPRRTVEDEPEIITETTEVIVIEEAEAFPDPAATGPEPDAGSGGDDQQGPGDGPDAAGWAGGSDFGSVWRAATRAADESPHPHAPAAPAAKPMAKKAVRKAAPATPPDTPAAAGGPGPGGDAPAPGTKAAKASPAKAAVAPAAKAAKAGPAKAAKVGPVKAAKTAKAAPAKAAEAGAAEPASGPAKAAKKAAKKAAGGSAPPKKTA